MTLYNPKDYRDRIMFDVPEIYVKYDLVSAIKGMIHLPELRFHLKELVVVRNDKGQLNISALKSLKPEKSSEKMPQMQIDHFGLKIGKVIYKDYSQGAKPAIKEFNVDTDEEYNNITSPVTLVRLIVVKAIARTSIERLANYNLDFIRNPLSTMGLFEGVAGKTLETLKNATENLLGR